MAKNGLREQVTLADTELPANICDFQWIRIQFLNSAVLQFLRRMEPLFRGVNLDVNSIKYEKSLEATRTTLRHVLPLLAGGIETICLHTEQLLTTVRDHLPTQQFYGIKHLTLCVRKPSAEDDATTDSLAELLRQWLGTTNGQPKMVNLLHGDIDDYDFPLVLGLLERFHQHFHDETSQASFFIRVLTNRDCLEAIQESTTQNAGTSEQLLVRKPDDWILHIGRCPAELNGQKWMNEMNNKMDEPKAGRQITVTNPKLGPIDEEAVKLTQNQPRRRRCF